MSARTTNNESTLLDGVMGDHPVLASEIIYKGTPVLLKSSGRQAFSNDGSTNTLANGDIFAGISYEKVDNSSGASGDKNVRTVVRGTVEMDIDGTVTAAKVGDAVYVNNASDDAAATLTSDTGQSQVRIGTLVGYVSATRGLVRIDAHVFGVAATA